MGLTFQFVGKKFSASTFSLRLERFWVRSEKLGLTFNASTFSFRLKVGKCGRECGLEMWVSLSSPRKKTFLPQLFFLRLEGCECGRECGLEKWV